MKKLFFIFAAAITVYSCSLRDSWGETYRKEYAAYPYVNDGGYADSDGGQGMPAQGNSHEDFSDNPFIKTSENAVSTFSVDADGAAYSAMRAYVNHEMRPPAGAVRIEEYLNYFTFDYPEPEEGESVAINAETGECPWAEGHLLLRLGLKGKSMTASQMPKSNYVFLVDVSGSMYGSDRIELVKRGLISMVDILNQDDRVSIITYSGSVKRLLESTLVSDAATIKNAISQLVASGATNGGDALKMAYKEASDYFIEGGNNRIIMCTDGDFNVGVTSTEEILKIVEENASKGIYMTVCGFGWGNWNDSMMETISNRGNGTCQYIDNEMEMVKVFVNERSKLIAVASDTKVQLSFDVGNIDSYRLIGYENRVMAARDFEDDSKDAGEIGAGQTITAVYELVPTSTLSQGAHIAKFDVRYKESLTKDSKPLSIDISASQALRSDNLNLAAGIAAYGMVLRDSPHKGSCTFTLAKDLVNDAQKGSFSGDSLVRELSDLIELASKAR